MCEPNSKKTAQNHERVLGCMVGGAIGDALGYAIEFSSWPQIKSRYGEHGITRYELDNRGVAPISDDTLGPTRWSLSANSYPGLSAQ